MMKRWKGYVIIGIILCIFIGAAVVFLNNPYGKNETEVHQLSYIYRGDIPEESQQAVKQGLEQASNDFNVEITTVAPNNQAEVEEQLELIEKELENGADAILIEPINDEKIADRLLEINEKIPVVEVNSQIPGEQWKKIVSVHSDNYKMGEKLARKLMKRVKPGEKVILLKSGMEYMDVKRKYTGVLDTLTKENVIIESVDLSGEERSRETLLASMMRDPGTRHIVAFDSMNLETLGKVKKEYLEFAHISLYGMGKTNQIVSYIEDETIQAIGISNEYSIGYLSAKKAVERVAEKNSPKIEIGFSIIDKGNIYTTKNQRLLFPFVQ